MFSNEEMACFLLKSVYFSDLRPKLYLTKVKCPEVMRLTLFASAKFYIYKNSFQVKTTAFSKQATYQSWHFLENHRNFNSHILKIINQASFVNNLIIINNLKILLRGYFIIIPPYFRYFGIIDTFNTFFFKLWSNNLLLSFITLKILSLLLVYLGNTLNLL